MAMSFEPMAASQKDIATRAEQVCVQPESLIKPVMTPEDWQKVHQAWAVKRAIAAVMGPTQGPWNQ